MSWLPENWHNCQYDSCPVGYTHTHGSGCNSNNCKVGYTHTHGSGCNTENCSHLKAINSDNPYSCGCPREDDAAWEVYTSKNGTKGSRKFKYQQDVSAFHAAMDDRRWCPGACEGLKDSNGNYYASYGKSPAHGVYSSMGGGDVVFYLGSRGTYEYKLTFWLETYDGSGSRNHNGTRDFRK